MGDFSRGDLRFCINHANDNPGSDLIEINVTGTIDLTGALPVLASEMEIRGPGADLLTIRRGTGGDYRIFTVAGGSATISGVTISNGRADVGGGIYNEGTFELNEVTVSSNTSIVGKGGGIYNAGSLSVANSTIISNLGTASKFGYGGGLYNVGTVTISTTTISRNEASARCKNCGYQEAAGGGIYNAVGGNLMLLDSTISINSAHTGNGHQGNSALGGGLFNNGMAAMDRSTVSENTAASQGKFAASYGGAILNANGMTITNSTLAKNISEARGVAGGPGLTVARGGAIYHYWGSLTIEYTTIALNGCFIPGGNKKFGGGIFVSGGFLDMHNALVAYNAAGPHGGVDILGDMNSSGYNLIGSSDGLTGYGPTDILDVDALLGDLQDYGGPTPTIALLPGSPAIDAGDPNPVDPPEWDQRGPGYPRIVNGRIDIGAFEVQATGVAVDADSLAVLITADFTRPQSRLQRISR
jgi:hypothetical protein